jgi:hypothetical protein
MTSESDIVERLRDPLLESYGDRLLASDEIERLRDAVRTERAVILDRADRVTARRRPFV